MCQMFWGTSLDFAGEGRFTGKFEKFTDQPICSPYSRWGVKQDVQIVVNGKILLEKSSGKDTFEFKFCN